MLQANFWNNFSALLKICLAACCLTGTSFSHPIISEFSASNSTILQDEDDDYVDWIEIYNPTNTPLNLGGYYLTDKSDNLVKWSFPVIQLFPGKAMIVFASEKRRSNPDENLHTNFKLKSEGEYLALIDKDGLTILQEFEPLFPKQVVDISYGFKNSNDAEGKGYFSPPSPGSVNGASFQNPIPLVEFSHSSQTFTGPFELVLSGAGPDQTIHVETNVDSSGSTPEPNENSPKYENPILVKNSPDRSLQVRARIIDADGTQGETVSSTFIYLEEEDANNSSRYIGEPIRNFTSDLPIVVLDNFNRRRPSSDRDMHISIYEPKAEGDERRASVRNKPDLETRGNMRQRGSSTGSWEKYSLALEFRDEVDEDRDLGVLGMPPQSDWVLSGRWEFDRALMRNPLMYELSRRIGRYAPRTRFVEVFSNTDDGVLEAQDYMGVYSLIEKVKRDPNRVDVEKLSPSDTSEPAITGGYMFKKDRLDPGDRGLRVQSIGSLGWIYPKEENVTDAQSEYLENYLNEFNSAIRNFPDYTNTTTGKHYSDYINVGSWVDEHLLRILSKDPDALRLSTYLFKPRGGKVHYGSVWDFDRCLGCDSDSRSATPGSFSNNDFWNYPWWNNLIWKPGANGTPPLASDRGDPDFNQAYIDRYFSLRKTHFSEESLDNIIDGMASQIKEAQSRNFLRWSSRPPNGGRFANGVKGWEGEVEQLKGWLRERVKFMDQQWLPETTLNQEGGIVEPGFEVAMSSPSGAVYYTLDGTDPRGSDGVIEGALFPGGQVTNNYVASFVPAKHLIPMNDSLDDRWNKFNYDDSLWASGITAMGFETNGPALSLINTNLQSEMRYVNPSVYARIEFNFNNKAENVNAVSLKMKYDDGFVAYLNGTEIARANAPETPEWNSRATSSHRDVEAVVFEEFIVANGSGIVREGRNVLAIQGMNTSAGGSDFFILPELDINETIAPNPLPLNKSILITSRTTEEANGRIYWSPPKSVYFVVGEDRGSETNIVVSEIMYHPAAPSELEKAAGFTNQDDFEWIELQNISNKQVNLFESSFAEGIGFDFRSADRVTLRPKEVILIVSNKEAFELRHGTGLPLAGTYRGRLDNNGEQLLLRDFSQNIIKEFSYRDASPWPEKPDGQGFSLELINPFTNSDHKEATSWTASLTVGGTPGVGIGENLPDKGNDTDGDNVPDDVEIAMGTDPLNPSSFALPEVGVATFTVEEDEHTFLYFTFQKTTNGTLDHFIIEQSRDLKNWESADADLVLMSEEKLENGISLVQYRGALPFDNQEKDGSFMRLRVIAD